jgi:hypothetical protein
MNIVGETSKHVGTFFDALKSQPLSLALVVMNFMLLLWLFYSGHSALTQRQETTRLIVAWQERTDQLMASCVSGEIMQMVLQALERDRASGRKPAEPERAPKQLEPHP